MTSHPRSPRFWALLAVFQLVFGLVVFATTRSYYLSRPAAPNPAAAEVLKSLPVWPVPEAGMGTGAVQPPATPAPLASTDPAEISRQADESFNSQQYDRAAVLYAQLLSLDPKNVDVLNNLGLTLHYLGRSTEALQKLNEGVALDPAHQRSWLTLGFVNSQLGNTAEARKALNNASRMGGDEEIRQSAQKMLEGLAPAQ
jgi:predicted Zn-dependent protease